MISKVLFFNITLYKFISAAVNLFDLFICWDL